MRKTFGLIVAIGVVGVAPGVAHATKFWGNCDNIAGTATFSPNGVSSQAQDTTYDFNGQATCTGAVGDQKLDNAPVHVHVSGPANVSCTSGQSTGDGHGTITLDSNGQTVPFLMTFTATGSEVDITIKGVAGGSGTGHASFIDQSNPSNNLTTLQNCGSSDGNKSLSFTAKADVPQDTALDDGVNAASPQSSDQSGSQQPSDSTTPSNTGSSTQTQPASKPKPKKHKNRGKHKAKGHHKAKHKNRGKHKAKGHSKH